MRWHNEGVRYPKKPAKTAGGRAAGSVCPACDSWVETARVEVHKVSGECKVCRAIRDGKERRTALGLRAIEKRYLAVLSTRGIPHEMLPSGFVVNEVGSAVASFDLYGPAWVAEVLSNDRIPFDDRCRALREGPDSAAALLSIYRLGGFEDYSAEKALREWRERAR